MSFSGTTFGQVGQPKRTTFSDRSGSRFTSCSLRKSTVLENLPEIAFHQNVRLTNRKRSARISTGHGKSNVLFSPIRGALPISCGTLRCHKRAAFSSGYLFYDRMTTGQGLINTKWKLRAETKDWISSTLAFLGICV